MCSVGSARFSLTLQNLGRREATRRGVWCKRAVQRTTRAPVDPPPRRPHALFSAPPFSPGSRNSYRTEPPAMSGDDAPSSSAGTRIALLACAGEHPPAFRCLASPPLPLRFVPPCACSGGDGAVRGAGRVAPARQVLRVLVLGGGARRRLGPRPCRAQTCSPALPHHQACQVGQLE